MSRERACGAAGVVPRGAGFAPADAREHYSPDLRLEPVHSKLAIAVDVPARTLVIKLGMRVKARAAGALALALDGIDLKDLRADGHGGRLDYDGRVLRLTWDEPFVLGEERELELAYRVERPVSGVNFSAPSAEYPDAPTFAVSDHETERARY